MRRLLESLLGALLSLIVWIDNNRNQIRQSRADDPWTAERKYWKQLGVLSVVLGVIVGAVALALLHMLDVAAANAGRTFQGILILVVTAAATLPGLVIAYAWYRVHRLERDD